MKIFDKLTEKQFVGLCFIVVELMLMWFFSSLGYIIHKDILLIYVVCGLILLILTPLFYVMWRDYPDGNQKFSLSHNSG